jgi:DNA polymerase V
VQHADATFFVRVEGNAFVDMHIYNQDVLIIDRSLVPKLGELALIVNAGDFKIMPMPRNGAGNTLILWGKITYIIHKAK